MKNFSDFFGKKPAVAPPLGANQHRQRSTTYRAVRSSVEGEFTLHVGAEAFAAMNGHVGLSFEEIAALPARVALKCRELGFAHREPVHFLFEIQDVPREPSWTVAKIVPPLQVEPGKPVERSIVVFLPTLLSEIETTKNELRACAALLGAHGQKAKQAEVLSAAPTIVKAKYQTLLSHEMVHIFATDEYKGMMEILGLELLELLTDSINLVTFYPDYKKAGLYAKMGVVEGIGYLANLLKAESPGNDARLDLLPLAHERAKKIIRQCREKCEEARQAALSTPGLTRTAAAPSAAEVRGVEVAPHVQ
jgi:hypothetical protein